jgi:hypothetical protein
MDNGYIRAVDNIEKVLQYFTKGQDEEYKATLQFNVFLLKMQPQYCGIGKGGKVNKPKSD